MMMKIRLNTQIVKFKEQYQRWWFYPFLASTHSQTSEIQEILYLLQKSKEGLHILSKLVSKSHEAARLQNCFLNITDDQYSLKVTKEVYMYHIPSGTGSNFYLFYVKKERTPHTHLYSMTSIAWIASILLRGDNHLGGSGTRPMDDKQLWSRIFRLLTVQAQQASPAASVRVALLCVTFVGFLWCWSAFGM